MLDVIVAVTITAPDLAAVEAAYRRWLDYEVVERGTVSRELAAHWSAPAVAGRAYLTMQPASGEPVYLRFVEQSAVAGAEPMRTFGWNATEILVEDPVALAAKLRESPFRIIGEPRPLSMNPAVVAMQTIGPAGELLYLTRIPPGKSAFNLGSAQSFVDRVFIVVLGGPDVPAMLDYYAGFGLEVTEPAPARVGVLNREWGFAEDHQIPLAIVRLPTSFLIEVDGYPAEARERPRRDRELPPGMAIVTFAIDSFDGLDVPLVSEPRTFDALPYSGRRVALARGAAGELIELIETGSGDAIEGAEDVEERED
ncbi:MAG TPA: hypothetical protein VLT59_03225 [Steroidobacteraceae bacterium]|nr:hypothetical protein [Steroidobacteraceae bacterium]